MKVTASTDTEVDMLSLSSVSRKKLKRNHKNQKGLLPLSSLTSTYTSLGPLPLSYVAPSYMGSYLPGTGSAFQAAFMFLIEDAFDPFVSSNPVGLSLIVFIYLYFGNKSLRSSF